MEKWGILIQQVAIKLQSHKIIMSRDKLYYIIMPAINTSVLCTQKFIEGRLHVKCFYYSTKKKNCKASLISMNKAGWKFCTFKSLEIQFIEMNNNNCKLEDVP